MRCCTRQWRAVQSSLLAASSRSGIRPSRAKRSPPVPSWGRCIRPPICWLIWGWAHRMSWLCCCPTCSRPRCCSGEGRLPESIALVLQVQGPGKEREAAYAFNALVEEYPADRLHTGREIALDDLAVTLPIRDTTGTLGLVPLTHGNLLYTAWALGLVTTLAPEEVLLHGLSRFFQGGWWPAGSS